MAGGLGAMRAEDSWRRLSRPARGRRRASRARSSAWPGRSPTATPTPRTSPRPRWCARCSSGAIVVQTPIRPSGTCCASCATSPPTRRVPAPGSTVEPWADVPDLASPELAPDEVVARADDDRVPRAAVRRARRRSTARCCGCASSRSSTTTSVAERLDDHRARRARQRVYRAMQALHGVTDRRTARQLTPVRRT